MVGETGSVEDRTAKIFLVKTDHLGKTDLEKRIWEKGVQPW